MDPSSSHWQLRPQADLDEDQYRELLSHIGDLAYEVESLGLSAASELHAAFGALNELLADAYLAQARVPAEMHPGRLINL